MIRQKIPVNKEADPDNESAARRHWYIKGKKAGYAEEPRDCATAPDKYCDQYQMGYSYGEWLRLRGEPYG